MGGGKRFIEKNVVERGSQISPVMRSCGLRVALVTDKCLRYKHGILKPYFIKILSVSSLIFHPNFHSMEGRKRGGKTSSLDRNLDDGED